MNVALAKTQISKGGNHCVILVHGLHSVPFEMRNVARVLHRIGFTTICPVLPGYSMGETCTSHTQWIDELLKVFDQAHHEYESVSLVGLSIGATLVLAAAAHRPQAAAIVALSTTLHYDGWAIPWYNFLLEPCYRLGIGRNYRYKESEPYGLKNELLRKKIALAMASAHQSSIGPEELSAVFLVNALRLGRTVIHNLPSIRNDALVIHAVDDETASPRNAFTVFNTIASKNKRQIYLGDSYHIISMDNERELVSRETSRFILASLHRMGLIRLDESKLPNTSKALSRLTKKASH